MTDESIFAAAIAIPSPDQRAAYLARACAGNPALRREVEELIGAHAANNPLDRPVRDVSATGGFVPADDEAAAVVGDRIGPYKLLECIGEGGMGEVRVADQLEPMKRRVALKLIKPGMDSRSVLGRFEAERQALAVMDHPNIAKVLDAGTTPDGRPYFVMELVKGTPITEFCDARKLAPNQRLELFIPVCQAIQHAHMKGIIHRDIKPSNVLVALHDERPVPKVIDFGVSKAIGHQLTEKTIYTGFGALIGTPAYMAPEQATFNQLDVDTRADVYALGVMLYELLTGSPPIELDRLKKAALDELLRIVRDEEPQRPSQRLSTSQAKATIAATRQSDPAKLSRLMRGELDWIVMKALEKDRSRRYDTANGLAKDIQRYLSGDSVEACPPTLAYRLRKAYRKNRAAVLTSAAFATLLLVATSVSIVFAVHAGELRRAAHAERDEKEQARLAEARQRDIAVAAQRKAQQERDAANTARDAPRGSHYAKSMNLMNPAWEADNVLRVMELLEENRPKPGESDLRGFEWHYWDLLCHAERRSWNIDSHAGFSGPQFSGDGRRLVHLKGVGDGQKITETIVCVTDVASGREITSFRVPLKDSMTFGMFTVNRDGSRIAYRVYPFLEPKNKPGAKGTVVVYDVASRQPIFRKEENSARKKLALSPDGKLLVTIQDAADGPGGTGRGGGGPGSSRWKINIWDLANPEKPPVVIANDGEEYLDDPPSFSRDGSRLVAFFQGDRSPGWGSTAPHTIRIWDTATGKSRLSQTFKDDSLLNVAFSPDATRLATVGNKSALSVPPSQRYTNLYVTVWDGADGDQLTPLHSVLTHVTSNLATSCRIAFSPPDGGQVAVSSPALSMVVLDVARGEIVQRIKSTARLFSVRYSEDGTRLLTLGSERRVGNRRGDVLQEWDVLPVATAMPATVAATPRHTVVTSANGERHAAYAAARAGEPAPSDDGQPPEITIRDRGGNVMHVFKGRTKPIFRVLLSPDGRCVLSTAGNAEAKFWDADTGKVRWSLPGWGIANGGRNAPFAAQFSPDGRWILLPEAADMKLFTVPELQERCKLGPVSTVYFSPDSRRLVSLDRPPPTDKGGGAQLPVGRTTVKLWDLEAGRDIKTLTTTGLFASNVTFSPDSRLIALSDASQVALYDAATGDARSIVKSEARGRLTFSPDGSRLSFAAIGGGGAAGLDQPTAVWDVATGNALFRLEGHSGPILSVAFSPDGKRIATAANSLQARKAEVKIWDAATGRELLTLASPSGTPSGRPTLAFSPDGHKLTLKATVQGPGFADGAGGFGGPLARPTDLTWDATPRPEPAK